MTEEAIQPEDLEGPTVPEPTREEQEIEDRARRQGWRPKEEYSGPENRWVSAKEFLDRGEREWPILRERMRKMDSELSETKALAREQKEVLQEMRDMAVKAEKRGYEKATADLAERERKAVEEANVSEYDRVQMEKRQLGPAPAEPVRRDPTRVNGEVPGVPPENVAIIQHWIGENRWFNEDREMNSVATALHGRLMESEPGLPITENLRRVRERIVQMYPDKFENPNRRRAASVGSSATPVTPKPRHKTVNDLPADAKEALAKFKRTMPGYTDEQYLQTYFGDDYNTPGV